MGREGVLEQTDLVCSSARALTDTRLEGEPQFPDPQNRANIASLTESWQGLKLPPRQGA